MNAPPQTEARTRALAHIDQALLEHKQRLQELRNFRKKQPSEYLDKLISSLLVAISDLKSRRKKIEHPDPKRSALILDIASSLHLSLRDHLPKNIDPRIVIAAAEGVVRDVISKRSRNAVESRHNKTGGARDKAAWVREAYATGKYLTKEECAEHAEAYRGIPFKTGLRALENIPKPRKD